MEVLRKDIEYLKGDVVNLEHTVYGNGSEGLKQKIVRIEMQQASMRAILLYVATTTTGLAVSFIVKFILG